MMRRLWLLAFIAGLVAMTLAGWPALASFRDSAAGSVTISAGTFTPVSATVDIDPDTLNPRSHGNFVTAYIELPDGYNVDDIDVSTVTLGVDEVTGSVTAEPNPTEVAGNDADGIPDRMVKFSRPAVVALLGGQTGEITFRVRGQVSGSTFEGTDTVNVLDSDGGAEHTESEFPQDGPGEAGPPPAVTPPSSPIPTTEYEVKPDDTLWDIARRFGTTVQTLAELNGLADPTAIFYGSTLNVPRVSEMVGEPTPALSP